MFTIRSLSDRQIADASIQYRIESVTGYVDFAILEGELCAHTWQCPKEGREFLQALENLAEKAGLRFVVPNVLNPALQHILITSGYLPTKAWDNYMKKECGVWAKHIPTILVMDELTNLFPKPKKEKMQNMYLSNRKWQQKEE